MSLRAALYACTTAADLGRTVAEEKLPEVRRFAALRDWTVVGEWTDAVPTGVGRRQGFDAMLVEVDAGRVDVIVANSISDLFWDIGLGVRVLERVHQHHPVALVCIRDSFDATTPTGWVRLLDALAIFRDHRAGRARDRSRIGVIRAQEKAAGAPIAGRSRTLINPMEVKTLYERGLAVREMVRELDRVGAKASSWKVAQVIQTLEEAGSVDVEKRAAAIKERGGIPTGGRPRPRGQLVPDEDLIKLYTLGTSMRRIIPTLLAKGFSITRSELAARLAKLRDAGLLDEALRLENQTRKAA